jgi:hypothetical protein
MFDIISHLYHYAQEHFQALIGMDLRKLDVLHGFGRTDAEYADHMERANGAAIAGKRGNMGKRQGTHSLPEHVSVHSRELLRPQIL